MKTKYYNDAIIGNRKMTASFSKKGELLRVYYPTPDYREFIDYLETGIKVNDSAMIYLHEDVNNEYHQYYTESTNILNTEIMNTYFNLKIEQTDCIPMKKDYMIKKYTFSNQGKIDLNVDFLMHSKLLSSNNNMVGGRIASHALLQYSHNYTFSIFSDQTLKSYQLNNSKANIGSGIIEDKDYIAMACDASICYEIGTLKPGEKKECKVFIYIQDHKEEEKSHEILRQIDQIRKTNINQEINSTVKYWRKYVEKHDTLNVPKTEEEYGKKLRKIYERTILLFPLLTNEKTGGIVASLEVDEGRDRSGKYSYCWPRDAVFIGQALDMLSMEEDTDRFYRIFLKNTQSVNGMWEQRFYTDTRLAPCWGYQIDETASVVFGVYQHYKERGKNKKAEDIKFLKDNLKMCEKAIGFLQKYMDHLLGRKEEEDLVKKELEETYSYLNKKPIYEQVSYDLWEMHEGVYLYSLSAIYAAFDAMLHLYDGLKDEYENNRLKLDKMITNSSKLEKYKEEVKKYILDHLYDDKSKLLIRGVKDEKMDVSIMGSVVPFGVFGAKEKKIQNTVEKINMTLRTYTGGYLRFEDDGYLLGRNPWTIATLWMNLYYHQIQDKKKAEECLKFVVNTATEHGFIAEQVDNDTLQANWVIGLGWAHAMFILALGSK